MGSCNSKVNALSWDCASCGLTNRNNIICTNCPSSQAPKDIIDDIVTECKKSLQKYNQTHILDHINDISNPNGLNSLISQIYSIDFEYVQKLYKRAMNEETADTNNNDKISPFPHKDAFDISSIGDINKLCNLGFEAITEGKCCVIILAGGQGTRLGFNKPKGCYPIGSISNKSIYQLQIEKILAVKRAAAACKSDIDINDISFPMYLMTSDSTHAPTKEFFIEHEYFKYDKNDIKFFKQMLHPCLNENDGKFIMKTANEIAMSPNGNGGIYSSLKQSGIYQDMIERGIQYIQIFGIDNILCRIGDPLWFGHMIETNADSSNKTCLKQEPHEKVGVMCLKNGKPAVTEYTELTKDMVELRQTNDEVIGSRVETLIGDGVIIDSTDKHYVIEMDDMMTSILKNKCKVIKDLEYCYGNLAMHQFSMRFMQRICDDESGINYPLPIHIARKKIPFYDSKESKKTIKPDRNNGIKLEYFVFDTYQYSEKCTVYNILRDEEFAPVKNPSGNSSPESARIAHSKYWKQEIIKNGGKFENDDNDKLLEVSPLFGYLPYGDKSFKERVNGKTFKLPIYLE